MPVEACRLDSFTPVEIAPVMVCACVRVCVCVCVCVCRCAMYVFDSIVYDAGDDGRTPGVGRPAHSRPLPLCVK